MTLLTDPQQNLSPPKPIPTHKGHWLWGGTFDFQRQPADFVLRGHERYGDIDVCLMPISAYFFRAVHLAPEDALQAAEDLFKT